MTNIYYFSGTGNTLWSARRIADLLKQAGEPCAVFNIAHEMRSAPHLQHVQPDTASPSADSVSASAPAAADAIVILSPAYAYQLPLMVRRFLQRVSIQAPYCAVIVTYGTSPGGALAEAQRLLARKKTSLSYAGKIPSVENYVPVFGAPTDKTVAKRTAMQAEATDRIARDLKERKTTRPLIPFRPLSVFVSSLLRAAIPLFVKSYRISDRCNSCGACARICPSGAISLQNGKPVFSASCEHCQACLNWCPMRAIQYLRFTPVSKRYHHPDVELSDMTVFSDSFE